MDPVEPTSEVEVLKPFKVYMYVGPLVWADPRFVKHIFCTANNIETSHVKLTKVTGELGTDARFDFEVTEKVRQKLWEEKNFRADYREVTEPLFDFVDSSLKDQIVKGNRDLLMANGYGKAIAIEESVASEFQDQIPLKDEPVQVAGKEAVRKLFTLDLSS